MDRNDRGLTCGATFLDLEAWESAELVGSIFWLPWCLLCYTQSEPLQVAVHIKEEPKQAVIRVRTVLWCAHKVLKLDQFSSVSILPSHT